MTTPWPKVPFFYLTKELGVIILLSLALVFSTFQWATTAYWLDQEIKSNATMDDQYFAEVCVMKARVDSISEFIGLPPV